jgi:undecaprenyl-diphosphatase
LGGLVLGFLAAGLTGYGAIAGLLALVKRRSLWPFALYCTTLGLLVLTEVLG